MNKLILFYLAFLIAIVFSSCERIGRIIEEVKPSKPAVKEFATGLITPLALELDKYHRLWVTEAGTGMNDGQVSFVSPTGDVYPVIEGFVSVIDPEGNPSGLNHLLWDNGTLWLLHGAEGRLYKAEVAGFKAGDTPIQASELEYQEIGSFVLGMGFAETNLYDLTIGPEGDLFMTDAGANAVIRRDAQTNELSVFAEFPPVENPTPVGPPQIDAVPTGIVFDGQRFLVSTLTGFPFLEGMAKVYEIDEAGQMSVYQDGLTTLVDIELALDRQPIVLQFAEFGETGWIPETGKIIQINNDQQKILHTGLSFASDMELLAPRVAYVTNLMEGKVLKVIY